jgi:hypothetical protein
MGELRDSLADLMQDCRNTYGPRGWQRALRLAARIIERGGAVYIETNGDGAKLDAYTRAMDEYIAKGDAFNMLDPMIAYGYTAVDQEGRHWYGKPQKVAILEDEDQGGEND